MPRSTPTHKLTFLSWLALYPLLTLLLYALRAPLGPIPIYLRTLLLTLILVPVMSYAVMPAMRHLFRGWLGN